jgi:phosphatidylserine/phosphatidylglycerophosphate/cardiolipin synthase-like enzyme
MTTIPLRALALILLSVAAAGANLLENPGFEQWADDSTPTGWRIEARSKTQVTRESDTTHAGATSGRLVRLVAGTGDNKGVWQRVPVQAGALYRYSVWCHDNSPEISAGVLVSWRTADSTYIGSTSVEQSRDSAAWQLVSDSAQAPAEAAFADYFIRTYGEAGAQSGNRVLIDDTDLHTSSAAQETLCVWFTQDSLAARLIDFFGAARTSIDYCCYNSSRPDVTLALISAHDRGVSVRVITDFMRRGDMWVEYLKSVGIVVWDDSVGPNSSAYMHNKFAVRDLADADSTNDRVWVASYNPNINETFADCALEIPGTPLARAYRAEFEQMWGGSGPQPNPATARFHTGKHDVLSTHHFTVNGSPASLYFGPQDDIVDTLVGVADRVQREVGFAVNAFTYDDLGLKMCELWDRGRSIFGTFDNANAGDTVSQYWRLREHGLPVKIDSFVGGTVHEKTMVIDSIITVMGSANWSSNANNSNDENILILNDPAIARRFMGEIVTRYLEAGGTYPPGILEQPAARSPLRRHRLQSPRLKNLLENVEVYDACGRRLSRSRPNSGVYFIRAKDNQTATVVLIR